jgi:hypothetical protein
LYSFLTYLRSTNQQRHTSTLAPPAYSKIPTISTIPTSYNTLSRIPEDEEACFCGEYPPQYFDEDEEVEEEEVDDDCCWGFANLFALAIYVGMIVIMVLNLDLFLSRWGVGIGMVPLGTASQLGSKVCCSSDREVVSGKGLRANK